MDTAQTTTHPPLSYTTLVVVWFALLILTALSVLFARMGLGSAGILLVLLITPVKAWLVMDYFMDLRHEGALLKVMFASVLVTLVVFIALTFSDLFTR
jgi:cytochrome c oxidase subunit 4